MSEKKQGGASLVSLLIGLGLLSLTIASAIKLLGISMSAQANSNTENLIDQVNRIGELMTVSLNRGGSFKNPDVQAKGIQICSLRSGMQCNGYDPDASNFCLSIPTRFTEAGSDIIHLTGFRLHNGILAQRDINDVDMANFNHAKFCKEAGWQNFNNPNEYNFTAIRLCRFSAENVADVTQDYEQNCDSVISNVPQSNMFWIALFKAKFGDGTAGAEHEDARIIHLVNTTRVGNGS